MSTRSLISLVLLLQAACGNVDQKKQELRDRNRALQNQIAAKDQEIANTRTESTEQLNLQAEQKTAAEKARDEANAELANKTTALQKAEENLNSTKAEVDAFVAHQQLIINSMKPSDGLWILDSQLPFAASEDTQNCDVYLRFESAQASLYRILICGDKVQLEKQKVTRIGVERGSGWNGTMGLVIDTENVVSSCQDVASILPASQTYALDFSQATASANTTSSNVLTATFGEDKLAFSSAATKPLLGKNRSCESIINRAQLESQKDNAAMQKAAKPVS